MAIYTYGRYATGGSKNLLLDGTLALAEANPIYVELDAKNPPGDMTRFPVLDVTPVGYTYVVRNSAAPDPTFGLAVDATQAAAIKASQEAKFGGVSVVTQLGAPPYDFVADGANLQAALDSGGIVVLPSGYITTNPTFNIDVPSTQLVGTGSGSDPASNTILRETTGLPVLSINASGTASVPILLKNLRIEATLQVGLLYGNKNVGDPAAAGPFDYIKFDNLRVVGSGTGTAEGEFCMAIAPNVSVNELTVVNSAFDNCELGWGVYQQFAPSCGASTFNNVTVSDTSFSGNNNKGIYAEKLSNATFTNVTVLDNGLKATGVNSGANNAGVDINLKSGTYPNISFVNPVIVGNGVGFANGFGIGFKARDDGASYSACPATASNVTITGGTVAGNERGIRVGEPDKSNAGPTSVVIHNVDIFGNHSTSGGAQTTGGLVNNSAATVNAKSNWWGAANGPSGDGTGGGDAVYQLPGTVEFDPFLVAPSSPDVALYIPSSKIELTTGATSFTVPVMFRSFPGALASVAFSVDYDQTCLEMPANGWSNVLAGMSSLITLNNSDAAGELDVAVWDPSALQMPDGKLLDMTFNIKSACTSSFVAPVLFGNVPPLSCGNTAGQSAACAAIDAYIPVDINVNPTFTPNTFAVDENVPAASVVGTFIGSDANGDTPLLFAFDGGTDDAAFTLTAAGVLSINASPNYEVKSNYSIKVKVSDPRGGSSSSVVTVTVNDLNEAPTAIALTPDTIAENNVPPTVVGTLSATDPDTTDTFSFAIDASCSGANNNAMFSITADKLSATVALDFEAMPVGGWQACVKVTDAGLNSFSQLVAIFASDVNEAPTSFVLSNNLVSIGQPAGFVIGSFSVTADPDGPPINQADYSYSEVAGGTGDAYFKVVGNQLQVESAAPAGSYTYKVQVTDLGVPGGTVEFTINVASASSLAVGTDPANLNVARKGNPSGSPVAVPVTYAANGNSATALTFAVKYNTTCLSFVSGGTEGPMGTVSVSVSGSPIADGATVATLNFNAKTTAEGCTGLRNDVDLEVDAVNLMQGAVPLATTAVDGKIIVIENSARGDCNADVKVNAGDFPATILEIFDADLPYLPSSSAAGGWLSSPGGTFAGSPYGCDSNATGQVDVADVVCAVNAAFNDYAACTAGDVDAATASPATLSVSPAAQADGLTSVVVTLAGAGNKVGAVGFSLFLDPAKVKFDPTDADADGMPDAVTINLPGGLLKMATWDTASSILQVAVAGISLPIAPIADGPVATILVTSIDGSNAAQLMDGSAGDVEGFSVPMKLDWQDPIGTMMHLFLPTITTR